MNLLDDPTQDLEDFIQDLLENGENKASEWQNRQEDINTCWESCRSFMMQRIVEANAVMDKEKLFDCFVCQKTKATVRCVDCMGSFLCNECDNIVHSVNPLHDRQTWRDGYYQFLPQGKNSRQKHKIYHLANLVSKCVAEEMLKGNLNILLIWSESCFYQSDLFHNMCI